MNILVASAGRHGSTAEIASRIGATLAARLRERGVTAHIHIRHAGEVHDLADYDAVILGSAVYLGRWLRPARALVRTNTTRLRAVPVWLFSSGPVGIPPVSAVQPRSMARLATTIDARDHRVFPGRLDRRRLGHLERVLSRASSAPDGDYRDWPAVIAWADDIASALCVNPPAGATREKSPASP